MFRMLLLITSIACLVSGTLAAITEGAGPNLVGDSPQARTLFFLADKDGNTHLTLAELHSVFLDFDTNVDSKVTAEEFLQTWQAKQLGDDTNGVTLFQNLDVNNDAAITEDVDMPFIFRFFDRNADQEITEGEFVIQWVKIST